MIVGQNYSCAFCTYGAPQYVCQRDLDVGFATWNADQLYKSKIRIAKCDNQEFMVSMSENGFEILA